jgi:hypothetical protein
VTRSSLAPDTICRGSLPLAVNLYQTVCPTRMVSVRDTRI